MKRGNIEYIYLHNTVINMYTWNQHILVIARLLNPRYASSLGLVWMRHTDGKSILIQLRVQIV